MYGRPLGKDALAPSPYGQVTYKYRSKPSRTSSMKRIPTTTPSSSFIVSPSKMLFVRIVIGEKRGLQSDFHETHAQGVYIVLAPRPSIQRIQDDICRKACCMVVALNTDLPHPVVNSQRSMVWEEYVALTHQSCELGQSLRCNLELLAKGCSIQHAPEEDLSRRDSWGV